MTLERTIKEIKTLPVATPEILEQIANKTYRNSDLNYDVLSDDNDGGPGGFCQLLSSAGLRQYLKDGLNNGMYGSFNNANDLCHSARNGYLLHAVQVYNATLKRPHALWYLEDNDWPDTARLAKSKDVIDCLKNIIADSKYYID